MEKHNENSLRICSFNINGLNTLFDYHPWSQWKTLDEAFDYLKCDVISLQELKLSKVTLNLIASSYNSFITIPRAKKGYSGVGVYVRKLPRNELLKKVLIVVKVEEGLTGHLPLPSNKQITYREAFELGSDELIGGYNAIYNNVKLDMEGRCILVELNYNIVIISLYCPANSLGTEEIEQFRMDFLKLLIERCRNLINLGKQVIVLGDINVSRDLIDSDEYIKEGIKIGCISKIVQLEEKTPAEIGELFEKQNIEEVVKFRELTLPKRLVNSVIIDRYFTDRFGGVSVTEPDESQAKPNEIELSKVEAIHELDEVPSDNSSDQESIDKLHPIFIDTLRESQNRRLKMYTCWNTLKNYRPINSGSRIDHIWATPELCSNFQADIWNQIMGSDHCPIFCDFDLTDFVKRQSSCETSSRPLKFEALNYYGVNNGGNGIDKFFKKRTFDSGLKHAVVSTEVDEVISSEAGKADNVSDPTSESARPSAQKQDTTRDKIAPATKKKPTYTSRKKQKSDQLGIQNFFFSSQVKNESQNSITKPASPPDELISSLSSSDDFPIIQPAVSSASFTDLLRSSKTNTPNCLHGEPATLRTSQKSLTKGKKFWCCARSLTSDTFSLHESPPPENRCNYFKWASK